MRDIAVMLEELTRKALENEEVRQKFLKTREEKIPSRLSVRYAGRMGYEIYEMELVTAGEEFYATMKRSTNGGGENSPVLAGEDDFYELFLANISK